MATTASATYLWNTLRDPAATPLLTSLITESDFLHSEPVDITHIRTAHYAVFKVATPDASYVVRIGAAMEQPFHPNNAGFLGTTTNIAHDQAFEFMMGRYLHDAGASVIRPIHYERLASGVDLLWLPFMSDSGEPVATALWHDALRSLQEIARPDNLPVFNNRQKTMARLEQLNPDYASAQQAQYDELLTRLFQVATRWGIVHGDVHRDNVINSNGKATLYDLDTLSWGPSVWDLTHLAYRHGRGGNTGYSVESLRASLGYSEEEFTIALRLRAIASEAAARLHALRYNQAQKGIAL